VSDLVIEDLSLGEGKKLRVFTLSAEKSLNALTQSMISSLGPALESAEKDPQILGYWLQGAGTKAFCAGGDIRYLYQAMVDGRQDLAQEFFRSEYSLDHQIHSLTKPLLCWGHGIVMGGGLGLFAGSRVRVVTEASKVAMPEITIGLFADVGASWFLNRMPPGVGLFLALTGHRMNATDLKDVGLANLFVPSEKRDALMSLFQDSLRRSHPWRLQSFLQEASALTETSQVQPVPTLRPHFDRLQALHNERDLLNLRSLILELSQIETFKSSSENFAKGSPVSAAVSVEQLHRSRSMNLADCFRMEFHLAARFAMGPDFREGVRALLIDKDLKPQWSVNQLESLNPVSDNPTVQSYFIKVPGPDPLSHLQDTSKESRP